MFNPSDTKTHIMKKIFRSTRLLLAASLLAAPVLLQAHPPAHYVPGVEGLKGASLPPPGFYVRDYNYAYFANQVYEFMAEDRAQGQAFVLNLTKRF